jgi:hypothetical protein
MTDYTQPAQPQYGQGPEYGQAPQYGQPPQYGQAPQADQAQYGAQYGQQQYAQAPQQQQYGYSPYAPPAGQYAAPAKYNVLSIVALCCGVVQFILGIVSLNILLAIPAVICGAIGMKQIKERNEQGKGLAIAGLVLGILGIIYFIIVVIIIAVFIHDANNINTNNPYG